MNQFKDYEEKLKKVSEAWETANHFDYILNNIWSTHSFAKGRRRWLQIRSNVEEPYKTKINTEISHVEIGHGIIQSRLAVKDEMNRYIEFLIGKYR